MFWLWSGDCMACSFTLLLAEWAAQQWVIPTCRVTCICNAARVDWSTSQICLYCPHVCCILLVFKRQSCAEARHFNSCGQVNSQLPGWEDSTSSRIFSSTKQTAECWHLWVENKATLWTCLWDPTSPYSDHLLSSLRVIEHCQELSNIVSWLRHLRWTSHCVLLSPSCQGSVGIVPDCDHCRWDQ